MLCLKRIVEGDDEVYKEGIGMYREDSLYGNRYL